MQILDTKPKYQIIKYKSKLWKYYPLLFPGAKGKMDRVWIAFGRRIYSPDGTITLDMLRHELVHLEQHGYSYWGALLWWIKYRASAKFRYSQEIPAFRVQLEYLCKFRSIMDQAYYRKEIAKILSGGLYGKVATYEKAYKDLDIWKTTTNNDIEKMKVEQQKVVALQNQTGPVNVIEIKKPAMILTGYPSQDNKPVYLGDIVHLELINSFGSIEEHIAVMIFEKDKFTFATFIGSRVTGYGGKFRIIRVLGHIYESK